MAKYIEVPTDEEIYTIIRPLYKTDELAELALPIEKETILATVEYLNNKKDE